MSVQSIIVTGLVITLVGAAIYGGLLAFSSKSTDSSRDALAQELIDMGNEAVFYRNRPRVMGGGNKDFKDFKPQKRGTNKVKKDKDKGKDKNKPASSPNELSESENGIFYLVSATQDSIVIDAVGNLVGSDNANPVQIRLVQTPSGRLLENLN